jgi:hypothetical protein
VDPRADASARLGIRLLAVALSLAAADASAKPGTFAGPGTFVVPYTGGKQPVSGIVSDGGDGFFNSGQVTVTPAGVE